jgi:hypothetical protein
MSDILIAEQHTAVCFKFDVAFDIVGLADFVIFQRRDDVRKHDVTECHTTHFHVNFSEVLTDVSCKTKIFFVCGSDIDFHRTLSLSP